MHMQKMKLFALLALTCVYVCTDAITGDSFSSYYGYGWTSTTLDCNDFVPCTVNCWGGASCVSVSINGPKNSSLTINCDSEFGGGGTNGVSSCIQMSIYAENSTSLTINVYNEDYGFKNNFVYTPNTNNPLVANTFITCGLIEDHNPSTPTTYSCGSQNNIYSLNGWSTVEWSYAGNASWALNLEPSIDPNTMRCGGDYQDSCELVLDGFYYRCSQSSVCDYDRSGEPQSHPQQGLPPTTSQPTSSPVAPTSSPTNPGDLASVYSSNTTLSSSMTYNVVSDIQIEEYTVFTVPGDVDIVFKGSYNIWVYGTINIGCDSIDTLSNHDIGIISESQLISIYNEDNSTRKGQILIVLGGSASFCNTRFTNLFSIFYRGWYPSPNVMSLIVDNCEFDNVGDSSGAAIGFYEACESNHELQQITDSKFINSDDGIKNAICTNIENNVFESPILCVYDSIINNNVFGSADHDGVHAVTTCGGSPNITFNTFINWQQAIRIVDSGRDPVNIFYNQFIDNEYAVFIGIRYAQHINYNNFVNNSYSIYESCGYTNTIRYIEMCGQPNCGYNYYGASSSNQSIISSQIYDICDGGQGHGLVTWWPWYTEPIDFNSLPTTLQEHNFDVIECPAADLHPGITDNKLAPIYPHDTTLASSNSPYYIVGAVRITTDATVYVESGVELIFADHYDIDITGALVTGCHAVETMNNHTIGIISDTDLISISSIDTTRRGRVVIQEEGSGSFCNTKFETLNSAIYRSYTTEDTNWNTLRLLIDNCEFYNNGDGVAMSRDAEGNAHISTQITDSKFLYNTESFYGVLSANITNNLFENAGDQTAMNIYSNVNIFRNTLTYNTTGWSKNGEGLYLMGINVNIRSNTFSNWPTAIRATWDNHGEPPIVILSMVVTQNEFIENTVAIDLDTPEQQRINYNNFIQNGYNIRSRNDKNQTHCNYNWNGDVDNITHPHLIASKIYDACDSDYYDGIVTFWPYFEEALDLTDLTQLPGMYSLDFVNCSFMNHTRAEYHRGVTSDPTIEPTANPTMRPTDDSIFSKISLNKLYMFVGNNPLNFFEAWRYCQDEYNTTLAQVHNEQQNQEMYSLVNQYSNYPAWIAASDLFMGENNWNWLDSMGPIALNDMNYTNWNATQPDNLNNEDCAIMLITDNNDQWGDADCNDASYNFVCYAPDETKPPTAAPTASPSQAPSPAPTKDPTPSPVQPPGYPYWFEWSSHFNYVWVNLTTNWFQASFVCQQDFGTDIASIHSEEDNAEAYEVCKDKNCWIGATDIPVHTFGTWQWNDQTAFEYTNWPNNIEPSLTYSSGIKFSDGPSGSEWTAVDADDTHLTVLCNGFPTPAPTPPSQNPTRAPSMIPSQVTNQPSISPSLAPTATPTKAPSSAPSRLPTGAPTTSPTIAPSTAPTELPTDAPSAIPSTAPSTAPTELPTAVPSDSPSLTPTTAPTELPTAVPSDSPTLTPTTAPTELPTAAPSSSPSKTPSAAPTQPPSIAPSAIPTETPSASPSQPPSTAPSQTPTQPPSSAPSELPTTAPSTAPSSTPSAAPTDATVSPSNAPSNAPTTQTSTPTKRPTTPPTKRPTTRSPTKRPTTKSPTRSSICPNMDPICSTSGVQFVAKASGVDAESGNDYDCLGDTPDPTWYYFEIAVSGVLNMRLYAARDIDFIMYGPYSTLASALSKCGALRAVADCSYSSTSSETPSILNARAGEIYILMVTNYAQSVQSVSLTTYSSSTASTNCGILPTTHPTPDPTPTPTQTTLHPTSAPSPAPTETPSAAPSQTPSLSPTNAPSSPPSSAPTHPTINPTLTPSISPSQPTINPTMNPSVSPTPPTTPLPTYVGQYKSDICFTGSAHSVVDGEYSYYGWLSEPRYGRYQGAIYHTWDGDDLYLHPWRDAGTGKHYYLISRDPSEVYSAIYGTSYAYCMLSTLNGYEHDIADCFTSDSSVVWKYKWGSMQTDYTIDANLVVEKCNTPEPTIRPTDPIPTSPTTTTPTTDTNTPTARPSVQPTQSPTKYPTTSPTKTPTQTPTETTLHPTDDPSKTPTEAPSAAPTQPPSAAPSTPPTKTPSTAPTQPPSVAPTDAPSSPSLPPSAAPTHPTINPTLTPSKSPSQPTINPTPRPSVSPTPPTTPQPTYVGQYRSDICFTGSQTIGVNGEYSYYGWVSEYYTEGAVYSYSYQGNTYYLRPWFDEGSWGHYYVITPSYYASTIYAYCHLSSSQPSYYTYDIAGCFSANNQWYYRSANGQAVLDSNLVAEKCNTPEPTNRPTYRPTNRPTRSPLARGDTHAPSKPPTQSPTYTEMTCGSTVSGTLHEGVHFYTLRLDSFAYSVHMKSCNSEFDVYLYDENYNEIETNVTYCASKRRAFHFVDVPAGGYAVGIGGFESYYGYYEMDIICDSAPIPTTTDLVASSEDDDHCELPSVHCNTQHVSFAHLRDGAFEFMVYDTSIWSSVHVIYFVWPYNEDNRRRLADDTACTQPSLSLEYEAIDNSYQYQNIRVFIEDTMIGNCYGQSERCEYTQCLDEFDLNTLDVDDISEIKSIRLLKGGPIRAYCDHNNTMRVRVVLKCKPIGDGFDVSPIDVGADDGLLGLIYFCVTFTILVFIWALSYFISNTKDTLKKNKAGSFKDVIKGSSKLNFISYGSAIYDTVSDFILSSDIMASAADSPNPALWRGLGSLSILTSIIGAVLFVLKIRILLQLLPRVVKWRSDRDEKLEEMARLIKTKENNGAHHIKLWYKTKQNHNDIKKYKGHIIMFNLFPIALENSIQCIVLFYIQYEALTNTSSGNVWDVLMWLKVVTSLFFMCFGIAKAFGIRWGFHQDSLDIGLKPNNAVDPEKKPNAYPFAYVRDGPPPQPSIGQLQNYINNNGQTYTSGGGMFVGQMPQPQEGNAPLPTGATGEEEEELVPGDDDSYHTDVEEHSIVNIELPAIQPQGPPQDPFKTLEYVMKAEEIRAKAEANQVGRQNLLDTAYPEQGKVDEGQDETIALTSDDTESNDETQVNENEMSSTSPSDGDANETATAVEDGDEREDHSS
eukprot:70221_1